MYKVLFNLGFNIVYKFSYGRYSASYYGETCRYLKVRVGFSGVSSLTAKKSKSKTTTAVKDHMLFGDHVVFLKDFKMLASSNSEFHTEIKESLLILRDKPELNRNGKFFPLRFFD